LNNVADNPDFAEIKNQLAEQLIHSLRASGDPLSKNRFEKLACPLAIIADIVEKNIKTLTSH